MSAHIEVDYPYVRAWSFVHGEIVAMGSVMVELAREDEAPVDAVFQERDGRWVRIGEVADPVCASAVREHAASYRRYKPGHEPDAS